MDQSTDINKFGGRFKYSKILNVIDNIDDAISSNIQSSYNKKKFKSTQLNQFAQYELCYGNRFHINPEGKNIKSTGFTIQNQTDMYILQIFQIKNSDGSLDGSGKGVLAIVKGKMNYRKRLVVASAGTVDYDTW